MPPHKTRNVGGLAKFQHTYSGVTLEHIIHRSVSPFNLFYLFIDLEEMY
jgi:hypothetical protein